MAYCSESDLLAMVSREELVELTAESGDTLDSQVVAEAINRADGEIDAYVGNRYTVPLAPGSSQIKGLSMDMAIYHLYSRRNLVPPVRQQKYEAAVSFLKMVAKGEAVLEGGSGPMPETGQLESEFSSAVRLFTRNTLGDW